MTDTSLLLLSSRGFRKLSLRLIALLILGGELATKLSDIMEQHDYVMLDLKETQGFAEHVGVHFARY